VVLVLAVMLLLLMLLLIDGRADASMRLALELEQEIQDIAKDMQELDPKLHQHEQCSDDGHVSLVISAAMTPPYPYGYGAEYVARCCPPPLLTNSPKRCCF